ncbi:heat shock factor protein 2 [Corchorus olitorius]|uniref:Heat shock factor protein 2 n=1 Tax=Corchorus olitorius TaxID=93759 RepID=A0A1R3IJJ8_9ROSI|nr:heat shock factor protein 2 [Corchorus olitorius]
MGDGVEMGGRYFRTTNQASVEHVMDSVTNALKGTEATYRTQLGLGEGGEYSPTTPGLGHVANRNVCGPGLDIRSSAGAQIGGMPNVSVQQPIRAPNQQTMAVSTPSFVFGVGSTSG